METVMLHFNDPSAKLSSLCIRIDMIAKLVDKEVVAEQGRPRHPGMKGDLLNFFKTPVTTVQRAVVDLQTCLHMAFIFQSTLMQLVDPPEKGNGEHLLVVQDVKHPLEPVAFRDPGLL